MDLIPDTYSGKALGQLLLERAAPDEKILIPRAAMGTEDVMSPLRRPDRCLTIYLYTTPYMKSILRSATMTALT